MHSVFRASPNRISNQIFKFYFFCCINKEDLSNTGIVIDDGLFEFKFIKEKNIQVSTKGQYIPLPNTCSIGKVGTPSGLVIPEQMTYFTIKIQPWVASFFLGNDHSAINDLSQTLSPEIGQLHTKIFNSNSFEEQIRHVEDFFLSRKLPDLSRYKISRQICNIIDEKKGDVRVKDLVALFPYSRQKLNQLFLEQTKNSIKEFAVLTRLRAIMAHHMNHSEKSLTTIAYDFGYFDQAHFIKDMKRITGVTPSKFSNTNNMFFEQMKNQT